MVLSFDLIGWCNGVSIEKHTIMKVAGINTTLTWPSPLPDGNNESTQPPQGVTFLLPGAMISISQYSNLRDVILEQQHLVVSLFMNPLLPLCDNHRRHAKDVKRVFDGLKSMYHDQLANISRYNIVGHSMGGKVVS